MTKSIAAWENQYGHLTNDPGLVAAWEADGLKVYSLYRDFASDRPSHAAIPRTPQEMIAFIGSNYNWKQTHNIDDGNPLRDMDVVYSLTVHDLLSAFAEAGLHDEPSTDHPSSNT